MADEDISPKVADKLSRITDSLDRDKLDSLPVVQDRGGLQFINYDQLLEAAKTMATAKSIPAHLRGSPGDCLMIREMAIEHGLSPYGLAIHSYLVNGILAHDAQAVNAMILKRAPTVERPRYTFEGEGDDLRCIVTATFRGEATPCQYISPPIGKITPKNSPLWKTDVEQQLCYFSIRRWARRFCPDIILGINSKDELEDSHIGADRAKDVSPKLIDRLPGRMEGAGFSDAAEEIVRQERKPPVRHQRRVQAKSQAEAQAGPTVGDSPGPGTETLAGRETPMGDVPSPGDAPPETANPETLPSFGVYRAALIAWMATATEGSGIIERYQAEEPLRGGFTPAERRQLEGLVSRRLENLG